MIKAVGHAQNTMSISNGLQATGGQGHLSKYAASMNECDVVCITSRVNDKRLKHLILVEGYRLNQPCNEVALWPQALS